MVEFDKKLNEIKNKGEKLELSADLDTEEKVRKVIQVLKTITDDLILRVEKLENK